MESWVLLGAVVVLALCVLLLAVLVLRQGRIVADLRAERSLETTPERPRDPRVPREVVHSTDSETDKPDFVITHLGEQEPDVASQVVPDRVVLSATLGEPLVKAMAFSAGVRRALSPETRNRIGFEVRREIKRSRKVRRREMREAWRRMKAERAAEQRDGVQPDDLADGRDVA